MKLQNLLSGLIVLLLISILIFYWFIPFQEFEFSFDGGNSNFSIYSSEENMQFYENMRFPNKEISYKIYACPLNKKDDMLGAFNILENQTILKFYPVENNEEIIISCDSKIKMDEGLFIAGEGGPSNITATKNFNIITKGNVMLIKESKCAKPNIALHELLHVLGFNHSENKNNIMYPITNCRKELGDIPLVINELYKIPSYADLTIEKASVLLKGKYMDINMSIRNNGLIKSENSKIIISSGNEILKEISLQPLGVGYGVETSLQNIFAIQTNVNQIDFLISTDFNELDKKNNKRSIEIKNN